MLTTNEKKMLARVLVAGFSGALLSLATMTAEVSADTAVTLDPGSTVTDVASCLFSIQLANDPTLRAAFLAKVAAYTTNSTAEETIHEDLYQTTINAGTSFGSPSSTLDPLSNDCLSCHDGVTAQSLNLRIKNNPAGRVMSLIDIIGSHPVGMEYDRYLAVNGKAYRGEVRFGGTMIFAEGKVGCLTCHNPLNTAMGHLVMENESSALCFSCHNK